MKSIHVYPVILVAVIILGGCSIMDFQDAKLPSWSVQLEVPLTEQVVELESLLDDSLISTIPVDGNGDSIFVFQDVFPIDTVEVGDQLNIDDINKSFSQSVDNVTIDDNEISQGIGFDEVGVDPINKEINSQIGLIELANIEPTATDPFQLDQIYPDIAGQPDGPVDSIPGFTLNPVVNPFTFDDFEQAVFAGGTLEIEIVNDMVITLGIPIEIQLQQQSGVDTVDIPGALASFNSPIVTGDSATASIDLTGMTLPGNIFVKVSGDSRGSEQQPVDVNATTKASSFVIKISARDLQVNSATAVVPAQTIDEIGFIILAEDSNKVQRAEIASGTLQITVDNGLAVDGDLVITIASLEDPLGTAFSETVPLVSNSTTNPSWSIDGYALVMDVNDQQVEYSYQVITEDSSPGMATLNETDAVTVNIDMFGAQSGEQLVFSQFEGIITPQEESITGTMDMDSESEILEARLSAGALSIDIANNFNLTVAGAPEITIVLEELFNTSGDTLVIGPQTLNPGLNNIPVDLSDHVLKMERNSQSLNYRALVTTEYGAVSSYALEDSILVDIGINGLTFEQITGYFTQDAMVDSNTIALDAATKVQQAEINAGQLMLTMVNHIGVEADINFIIEEFYRSGASLDTNLALSAVTAPQSHIIPLSGYTLELPLTEQNINYVSRISIPSTTEMTLSFNDSIAIAVDITSLAFQSVTGIIDPVTVDIDTINQEITALPEEFDGIDFADVSMIMDFETNIGVPVFLDLNITASNSDGEQVTSGIAGWNITDSSAVRIPNAADLINVKPESIVAAGQATVGGGVTPGTVASDQYIQGEFVIDAPLELILTDDAQLEMDPDSVDTESFPQELEKLVLYAKYDSEFDFGTMIEVLAAPDTNHFKPGSPTAPTTLFVLEVLPNVTAGYDSVLLDEDELELFDEDKDLYVKTIVDLVGEQDNMGNDIPARFLSTDTLKLLLYGSVQYLVDPEDEGEEE